MEERNYKLYVHISPNGKRYYGITGINEKRRWNYGNGYKNQHFQRAINKYGWENFEHIVLFDNLTKKEACLLEQMYIALYNTTNPKYGYNKDLGGNVASIETINKRGMAIKGKCAGDKHYLYGKHHTKETIEKMSIANSGENNPMYGKKRTVSNDTRAKISKSMKNKGITKVICLDTGEVFDSIQQAELKYNPSNKVSSNISACCRGKQKVAYKHKWMYYEDYIKEQEQQAI